MTRYAKTSDEAREQIRDAWAQGAKQRDLAQQFGVSQAYISKTVDGIPKVRASSRQPKRACVDCGTPLRFKTRCEPCNRAWRNAKEKKRQADLRAARKAAPSEGVEAFIDWLKQDRIAADQIKFGDPWIRATHKEAQP